MYNAEGEQSIVWDLILLSISPETFNVIYIDGKHQVGN